MQRQNRRIPQIPQSHDSKTTKNSRGLGRPSVEFTAAYNFFPTESSGIAPFFLMFECEAAVKHTLLQSENPKYLGTNDGMINMGLMTKLYNVVAHNLNEARKARDRNKKGITPKEPEKLKIGDNILVRDHTSKAFQPKYKDFCIIGLLGKKPSRDQRQSRSHN